MNNGSYIPEECFKGLSDNFFDDLINHIDFPLEDIETANDEGDWDAGFQNLVPPPLDVLSSLSSEFTCGGNTCKGQQRMRDQKPVIPVLKQSSALQFPLPPDVKVSKLFQSSSPVSVLEIANGSVSSQNPNRAQRLPFPAKRTRSKRKRPTPLRFRFFQTFVAGMWQQDESGSETHLSSEKKRKRNYSRNKNTPLHSVPNSSELFNADGTVRKCSHCETTKTPQWREGPNGPKTLCNACGVRFRSGRLVPEYRPASSPTFVPTVHSNSHRKIIEMRRKGEDQFNTGVVCAVPSRA